MTDFLVDLAQNRSARKVVKTLGLPLPMPQKLRRAAGAWTNKPLSGCTVEVETGSGGKLGARLKEIVVSAGATLGVNGAPPRALVFDGSGLWEPEHLREMFDFFQPRVAQLAKCGRVVVVARTPDHLTGTSAATMAAMEGFVRSLAKEIGARGATANLLYVGSGADTRVEGPLRFLLSDHSAYVTGQPLRVSKVAKGAATHQWTRVLDDKVALVTGAARGIGAATARSLAAEGANVICVDRPEDLSLLQDVASSIVGTAIGVDLTCADAAAQIEAGMGGKFDGIDILVNNAGVTRDKTLAKMAADRWDQVVAVNLSALIRLTEELTDGALRDGGRVICLSSIAGIAGNFGQTNYAATKAGVLGYVRSVAPSLGKSGITINAVAPGFIDTRMTQAMPIATREVAKRLNALAQGGVPQDIAEAVTFFASPGAQGITGSLLRVCGLSIVGA